MVTPGWFFRMPVIVAPAGVPWSKQSELKLDYQLVETSAQTEPANAATIADEGVHHETQFCRVVL